MKSAIVPQPQCECVKPNRHKGGSRQNPNAFFGLRGLTTFILAAPLLIMTLLTLLSSTAHWP